MKKSLDKILLIVVIVISFFPLLIVFNADLNQNFTFSKTAAYVGLLTLWWGYVLGIRRFIGTFIADYAWVLEVHKWFNILGFLVILAHPVILVTQIYGIELLIPNLESERRTGIALGSLALIIWAIIWVTSALIKNKLSFRWWKRLHLLTYPILFFSFIHLQIGFLVSSNDILQIYTWWLFGTFVLLVCWQIAGRVGIGISNYTVVQVTHPADLTVTLLLNHANGSKIKPEPGQYIYIQTEVGGESHPFSISDYNQDTEEIEITIKDLGKFSSQLQNITEGTELIVDGPYGVFLQNISEKNENVAFLAGGIGITPFLSKLRQMRDDKNWYGRNFYLFYGCRTSSDIAFRKELENLAADIDSFNLIIVLDSEPNFVGETGFITPKLINKYIDVEITAVDFYICGPPIMIDVLSKSLNEQQVPQEQIEFEKFSN